MSTIDLMVLHVPEDPDWLRAFGRVAIVHAHLEHVLRMFIKTLANVTIEDALDATERETSSSLRDRAKKIARQRLGEGAPLIRVQALIARCKRATDQRNELIHNIIGSDWRGTKPAVFITGRKWGPLPTVADLTTLEANIGQLITDINHARIGGWLAVALAERPPTKATG